MGDERRFQTTRRILHGRTYRIVRNFRAKFTRDSREKRDERDGLKAS
jgi:hypothetical protein